MKKLFLNLTLITLGFFTSCDSFEEGEEGEDGIWGDIIKFSTTELNLNSAETTEIVTSKGDWWWILNDITIDNKTYNTYPSSPDTATVRVERGRIFNPSPNAIYDEGADQEIKKIIGEWFTVTKESTNKLVIHATKNDSGKERFFYFPVEAGNYFTGIKVTQK